MDTEYVLSYTGSEIEEKLGKIDSLATKNEVPTKTSQFNNDSGFITDYTETDPTVPAWAKAETKPTYTASEVGADASGTASSVVSNHNISNTAHADIREQIGQLSFNVNYLNNYVTPQMYGAKGDGVTDDTTAFKNALANNDNVFVPSGNYLITDTLDISYKKSLVSDAGQRATIFYNGIDSVVSIGRMSMFRNINITVKNAFDGIIFDTNNHNKNSGEPGLGSRVEHVNIDFEVASQNATLIGITVDSGTDANNIPRLTGVCFQTYHDIHVDNSSCAYGYGIKMQLIQGRAFTEETRTGFPWITHIDYDDISLGHPHTAIKSTVINTSGSERFERVSVGHILFNNVYTQYLDSESTQIFLDLDNFGGYFTKCIPWDYHPLTWAGEKINIIGANVSVCISGCAMASGAEFLKTCDFIAETEYTIEDNPEYFMSKYFSGTVLSEGYDSVNAKIDAKLSGEYIGNIAEEKINDVLYSGYSNILIDPLTQIKVGQRFSNSSQTWEASANNTTVIIPIVTGGNIIRWSPLTYALATSYQAMFFFNNDELTTGVRMSGESGWSSLWVSEGDGGYLQVDNPSGYKYVSIPFNLYTDISAETMTMTINREITGSGQSYTEYLREGIISPAIAKEFKSLVVPTKTSQLENDSGFLTQHQDISGKADKSNSEEWIFTLSDGSTVTKKVVLA